MESLANYESEDEHDSDVGHKVTEAVISKQECSKCRTEDTNYDTVGMDLSEDSITINNYEGSSNPLNSHKEKRSKLKEKYVQMEAERQAVTSKKEKKDRNRPKERYKDYYKEERTRNRDRRKDYRVRKEYRRDREDYRDRDRNEYQDRDREYKQRTEKNSNNDSPSSRDRYKRDRKSRQSKSKSRERSSVVKSPKDNTNDRKDHEHKAITQASPSSQSSKNIKQAVPENKANTSTILPNYYNPNVINPNKYAEQAQKRKLLWSNKKPEDTSSKWENAKFAQDADGKVASKFMRLMGIKSAPKVDDQGPTISSSSESIKKREEMFSSMEQQYEVARQVTHTMRGVGLGFSSQSRQF